MRAHVFNTHATKFFPRRYLLRAIMIANVWTPLKPIYLSRFNLTLKLLDNDYASMILLSAMLTSIVRKEIRD